MRRFTGLLLAGMLSGGATQAAAGTLQSPETADARYVCRSNGDNKNPGSKDKPFKNIDKALKAIKGGETILVCEGVYSGTFDIGYFEAGKPVKLYGGYAADFSARDPLKHQTLLQPDNKSGAKSRKAILTFKDFSNSVLDGFVIDMGMRNSYHASEGKPEGVQTGALLLPPAKAAGENATVTESCVDFKMNSGDSVISNNVFANCAQTGIQGGVKSGKLRVTNNVFAANRIASAEIFGTCPTKGAGPAAKETTTCADIEFDHNTVLFTWSRLKDFQDMGYGFRIMTKTAYNIHDNIIGTAIKGGMDHCRFNKNDIKIDRNGFFVNKDADFEYCPEGNTTLRLRAEQFGDLELGSVSGNVTKMPKGFPIDQAYLDGFLSARYSEESDYDPNSSANVLREVMGMNKQGKLKTSVTMFANRYPVDKAVTLFGGVDGMGAQAPN